MVQFERCFNFRRNQTGILMNGKLDSRFWLDSTSLRSKSKSAVALLGSVTHLSSPFMHCVEVQCDRLLSPEKALHVGRATTKKVG